MGITIGDAILYMRGDNSHLKRDTQETESTVTSLLGRLGGSLQKWGATLSLGITTPLMLLANQAITASSNLNESINKSKVVFGEYFSFVSDALKNSADQFGMSQQKAMEAAGTYGNLFTAMGVGTKTSAELSTQLVSLAADLASFNNIKPEDALYKLRAALIGESEPMRVLGVNITAAATEVKALEMGFEKVGKTFSNEALIMARYQLILEQTAVQQGDFGRTANDLANSQRRATAAMEDMMAKLGTSLLPLMKQLTSMGMALTGWFNGLSPVMQQAVIYLALFAAGVGPVMTVIGTLMSLFAGLPGLLLKGAMAFGTLQGTMMFFGGIKGIIANIFLTFANGLPAMLAGLQTLGLTLMKVLGPLALLYAAIQLLMYVWEKMGAEAMRTIYQMGAIAKIKAAEIAGRPYSQAEKAQMAQDIENDYNARKNPGGASNPIEDLAKQAGGYGMPEGSVPDTNGASGVTTAEKDLAKRRISIVQSAVEAELEATSKYADNRNKLIKDGQDAERERLRAFQAQEKRYEEDYYADRIKKVRDHNIEDQRDEEEHQIAMTRKRQDAQMKLDDFVDAGDAAGWFKQARLNEIERQRDEEDYNLKLAQRDSELAQEIADDEARFASARERRSQDFAVEQEQQAAQQEQRLADLDSNFVDERRQRQRQFDQQMIDLYRSSSDETTVRRGVYDQNYNDLVGSLSDELNARASYNQAVVSLTNQMLTSLPNGSQLQISPTTQVNVGKVEYRGSFSQSEMDRLDRRTTNIVTNTVQEALAP